MSAIPVFADEKWRLPSRGRVAMSSLIIGESAIFTIFVIITILDDPPISLGASLSGFLISVNRTGRINLLATLLFLVLLLFLLIVFHLLL